ncbi:MAG: hypothetical protein AAGC57_15145 [Pseudomonadota bacterium]
MGIVLVLVVLFLAVAILASQFPHWLTAVALVLNIAVYALAWGGLPERPDELGTQVFHIMVLVGGQIAAILGLLLPLVWSASEGSPRWLRALGAGVVTLPLWLLVPFALY